MNPAPIGPADEPAADPAELPAQPAGAARRGPQESWAAYAREVLERVVRSTEPPADLPHPPEPAEFGGAFVTLRRQGALRGCMGCLETERGAAWAVREAAVSAALHDPRFPPLAVAELPQVTVQVSLLSRPVPMATLADLRIGTHGVLVCRGSRRGLFLPQVAVEHGMDAETFLRRCCVEKAGLPPDAWRDPQTQVWLFTTQTDSE